MKKTQRIFSSLGFHNETINLALSVINLAWSL